MKGKTIMKKFLSIIGLAILIPLGVKAAGEVDYTVESKYTMGTGSLWPTATASNLALQVNATMHDQFAITIKASSTNVSGTALAANGIDIRWSKSINGSDWPLVTTLGGNDNAGWFAIPLTNQFGTYVFTTNITMNAVGYYRLDWLTNATGVSLSNLNVSVSYKPKRTGTGE